MNDNEYKQIRTHTYYTYNLLSSINQFQTINEWASFHHEKLDGKGYPFRIKGERLSLGSRIMAVADVFTAITENRPYRLGMTKEETERILLNLVKSNAIDGGVVDILLQNFEEINRTRILAQKEAKKHYEKFLLEK
ncbi:MAG: HD domain-containing protein [Clostridiales bacterium]|nr:HD domain-containing protein [Clostridiales bacterium]